MFSNLAAVVATDDDLSLLFILLVVVFLAGAAYAAWVRAFPVAVGLVLIAIVTAILLL